MLRCHSAATRVGAWRARCAVLCAAAACAGSTAAAAEEPAEPAPRDPSDGIEELVVRARRPELDLVEVPLAVSELDADDVQLGQPLLTIAESLALVPGVYVQNRANFAQDARISIRGFGARANFGLRGIRLYVDGIPQTLPDGQGQLDSLSMPTVGRIEVMRGPSSTLYGSAAGGVILVETETPGERPAASARGAWGSYGYQSYDAEASARLGAHDLVVGVVHQQLDGYRDHAEMVTTQAVVRHVWRLDERTDLATTVQGVYSPKADDPGGLGATEASDDPTAAWGTNVQKDAGESVSQVTLGSALHRDWSDAQQTTLRGFLTWRGFDGRLPVPGAGDLGQIDLDRIFAGGSIQHVIDRPLLGRPNRVIVGVEGSTQRDDRRRYQNQDGGVRGPLQLDQDEDVSSIRAFVTDEWALPADLTLAAGVGYDHLFYRVDDQLPGGVVDASGKLDFGRASPAVSLGWAPRSWANPYARFATSFEPPTTTELADPLDGGFVSDLEAQLAMSWELGVKGKTGRGALTIGYELVGYYIQTKSEIVPQDIGGLTEFVNAGRTRRSGLELMLDLSPAEGVRAYVAYAFGVSRYVDYERGGTDYAGNRIPGIPDHVLTIQLRYQHRSGLWGQWETRVVSDVPANDENDASAAAYAVNGLSVGWTGRGPWIFEGLDLEPYVAIDNITDQRYVDNVRINAFGDRYYEPAPALSAFFGLRIRHSFGPGG